MCCLMWKSLQVMNFCYSSHPIISFPVSQQIDAMTEQLYCEKDFDVCV